MSAIDFAKIQKQMRAEAAARRKARAADLSSGSGAPSPPTPPADPAAGRQPKAEAGADAAPAPRMEPLAARSVDLEQHRCPCRAPTAPRDIFYIPDFVDKDAEAALVASVAADAQPWVQLRERRLQCHGGTVLPEGTVAEPIPAHLQRVCTALHGSGIFTDTHPPNHVLVNEYSAGEGIMPHRDGPLYHPSVAILSLRAPIAFDFWPSAAAASDPDAKPAASLLLEPRSLLIFRGDAYTDFHHAIAQRAVDALREERLVNWGALSEGVRREGGELDRSTRLSLTVRHVLNICATPARADGAEPEPEGEWEGEGEVQEERQQEEVAEPEPEPGT